MMNNLFINIYKVSLFDGLSPTRIITPPISMYII